MFLHSKQITCELYYFAGDTMVRPTGFEPATYRVGVVHNGYWPILDNREKPFISRITSVSYVE